VIAITFALPAESSGLKRLLRNPAPVVVNQAEFIEAELQGKRIALLHTGVGVKVCQQRLKSFLDADRFTCLISAGFAGALADDLRVGELFIAENFSSADLFIRARRILTTVQPHFGNLVTASAMIDNETLRMGLKASSGARAVDMETECIAQACAIRGIPLLSLRAISDAPDEPFPVPLDVLFNLERQQTDFGRLALHLLKHPVAIIRLIQFSRRIAKARAALTSAIDTLVRSDQLAFCGRKARAGSM
jgi:adenosylhomocysteine nucleosidase